MADARVIDEEYIANLDYAEARRQEETENYAKAERLYRKALLHIPSTEAQQAIIDKIRSLRELQKKPKKDTAAERQFKFEQSAKTFADIIGYGRHKKLLRRWIEQPLKQGDKYKFFDMPRSTGIIFYGPPGTGKTLMAKAVSGEFKIPMRYVFISDILDKLVGGSEKNMRKIFEDAKASQPAIIFFDELDALGSARESANEFTSNDIKNTVNEFMTQLSELHDDKVTSVFVIAATNLPWLVDDAIKRSGRLEHFIYMGTPNFWDRRRLFHYYLGIGSRKYARAINLSLLSFATMAYTQADIEKVCSGAKRRAIEKGRDYVTTRDIQNVLKDRDEGKSSFDSWLAKAKQTYIKQQKTQIRHTGFLGLHRQKERVEQEGKLSMDEQRLYKPLINDMKSKSRWRIAIAMIRFIARGF